jgi:hypothetical protein
MHKTATTKDGKEVKPNDVVWVQGSCGVEKTHVASHFEPVTTYQLWLQPIKVSESYSTKKAALEARHT